MGYRAWISKEDFHIPSDKITDCLKSVMNSEGNYETPIVAATNIKHFEHLPPLVQLMEVVRETYGFNLSAVEGGIHKITFEWEKLRDYEILFNAIAPYVTDDSYLEWCGEDGSTWRSVFKQGTCKQVAPTVTWG